MKALLLRLSLLLWLLCSCYSVDAADYYWVGGTGNWSDLSHWATTSGGATGHIQVPTADDDVFFDAGSFNSAVDIITLNSDNIFFRDMIWNQAIAGVSLVGASNVTISVYGAFVLSPGMIYDFDGDIIFNSEQLEYKDITGHGFKLAQNVLFDSRQGQWTFTHNVSVDSIFQIQDGIVSIEPSIEITTQYLRCNADEEASLILEGSMVVTGEDHIFNNVDYRAIEIESSKFLIIPSGTSTILITGENATLYIEGETQLGINYLDFSNTNGTSKITLNTTAGLNIVRTRFLSNAIIQGQLTMSELILTESKSYNWESGILYEIGTLIAVGTCSGPINLASSIPGQAAQFFGNCLGEYLNIKDITIAAGSCIANNSLDLGNTDGWVINERSSQDLYWVGGSGNWDDASHWASTSGGAGGACIPSANDNVFFDGNSFNAASQIVNLNIDDAFCRSMDWTGASGNPNLNSDNMNLHINGSLIMNTNMNVNFTGDIFFESDNFDQGNTITTFGKIFGGNAWFTGSGEWGLIDDFEIGRDIIHNSGLLDANGSTMTMTDYRSESDSPRELSIGSAIFRLRWISGNGPEFIVRGPQFAIDADNSTIEFPDNGYISLINTASLEFNRVLFYGYGGIGNYNDLGNTVNESRFKYVDFHIWGDVGADMLFDTIKAQPRTRLLFSSSQSTKVEFLDAQGTCANPINIAGNFAGRAATIETSTGNSNVSYAFIQDVIVMGGAPFSASNSVDLGNNQGWNISALSPRTLYWVGDGGSWNDPLHWALTSGGSGGECIPTPEDDVIFDSNSFSVANELVQGGFCFFKNMDWSDLDESARIDWDRTFAYGSIYLSELVEIDRWNGVSLGGSQLGSELDFKNKRIGFMEVLGVSGEWTLISDLQLFDLISLISGTFDFGDVTVNMDRFFVNSSENDLSVDLGSVNLYIHGGNFGYAPMAFYTDPNQVLDFDPGTSTIYLTNAQTGIRYTSTSVSLNNVRATDANGVTTITVDDYNDISGFFNKVQFDGDAVIDGITSIDSLILAPGKSYQLKSGVAQTINRHLQILGNNCSSIELTSTQVGNLANIDINNFEIVGDFIQMRDIRINNSESSFAGIHSTDIGNSNVGWIFDDAPNSSSEEQGFFGDDQVLCNGSAIVLEAYPFNANATFQWQDGSIESTLDVDMPGEYWARVTFDGSCSIIDTIQILPQDEFAVVLGNDTTLCDAETLLLDVSVSGAMYMWQDGTGDATFNVTEAGEYSVEVNLAGCSIQDTIEVGYISFASIDLGADQVICEDDDISFDVTVPGGTYLWQDNSNLPTFTTEVAGQYYVDVTTDNCTATDTIVISITELANVDLGSDTIICDGLSLELSTEVLADSYLWSDGNTTLSASLPAGKHYLDLTLDGCTATDTIVIDYKPYPVFELGVDTTLCTGESLAYDITGSGDNYTWSNGSNLSTFNISTEGQYDVIVGLDGCIRYDTIDVIYAAFPLVDLGIDTILCEDDLLTLSVNDPIATSYDWQDGSTSGLFEVNVSGQYYVDAFNSRCKSTDTINVQFNPRPIFDLGEDMIQCLGEPLEVDANVAGASYIWSDGTDFASNSFNAEGDYWVDVTLDGCTVRDSVLLRYIQIPDASLGRDTTLCEGDFLSFDFSNLNLGFEWNDATTDPIKMINQPGTYWLEVTDRDCASRDSVTLLYKPSPIVDLGRDTMLCTGDRITLTQGTFIDETIRWSDGSMGNVLAVENSGAYSVEIDKNGCVKNDEIIITFNDPPSFDFGQDTLICEQQPLVLQPGISGATYRWQDGSGETSFIVDRPGFYEVEVTKDGCTAIDNIDIETRTCTFYRAYLPEIFSPNNDGLNDTYQPGFPTGLEIISYSMTVYDRWGSQIFVSEDPLVGWDGTFNQAVLNRGTYIYAIAVEYIDDRGPGSKLQRGEVLLVR